MSLPFLYNGLKSIDDRGIIGNITAWCMLLIITAEISVFQNLIKLINADILREG